MIGGYSPLVGLDLLTVGYFYDRIVKVIIYFSVSLQFPFLNDFKKRPSMGLFGFVIIVRHRANKAFFSHNGSRGH